MINRKISYIKYISCILTMALLLCGCGKVAEIPELIDPVSSTQAFRPVERRVIGDPKILVGQVVLQEYCHFFKKSATIKQFNCDIGQYVNEGDILAYADVEKLQEELTETQAALALCVAEHEVKQPILEYTVNSLLSQRSACEYLEDTDGAAKITTQINIQKENHTYDEELYNFMVESYNEEITELQELIQDGTLKAKKSGYVTYIKNTAAGNVASVKENVVIISDYTDTHIEVPNVTTKDYKYKKFDIKYAIINGEKVDISEFEYSNQELVYAKAQDSYPNIRFKPTKEIVQNPGDTVLLYFLQTNRTDVLTVGRDSTNSDENGTYVYVQGADGNLEKKYFESGTSDSHYMEVKSGLEEGELVLYVQESATPSNYEPYTVTLQDYVQTVAAKRYESAATINTAYFTPCDGKVDDVLVSTDDEVKKGDALLVIDSGGGTAELTAAENDIKHLEKDYTKQCKDLDKQMGALTEQSLRYITTIEMAETDDGGSTMSEEEIDAIQCQRGSLANEVKILAQQKELARLEYEDSLRKLTNTYNKLQKNNNGAGKITIVAEDDGVVGKINVKKGTVVKLNGDNSLLFSCSKQSNDKISITVSKNSDINATAGAINIGSKVVLKGEDKNYDAVCIGSMHNNNKNYAFTEGDKVYVTSCICDEREINNYVFSVSESDFFTDYTPLSGYEAEVKMLNIPQMIVILGNMVYSEVAKLSEEKHYYVWKIENDELVKQYITTGTDYGIGNNNEVVVLTGLSKDDVLAKEFTANTVETTD